MNHNGADAHEPTILVVDDNLTNIWVLSSILEDLGYTILVARDGKNGIETAEYATPDMILLDVMMPGIDGFETCQRLKENPKTKNIPIIFMTALTSTENKIKGFNVGAIDYITKPLQQEEVITRVKTYMQLQMLSRNMKEQNEYLKQVAEKRKMMHQLSLQLIAILEIDKLITTVAQLIQSQLNYAFVGVWELALGEDELVLKACAGEDGHNSAPIGTQLSKQSEPTPVWEAYQKKERVQLGDQSSEPREEVADTGSEIALPLRMKETILGVLDIQSNQNDAFSSQDGILLQQLADHIAIAIRNARMYLEVSS